MDTFDRLTNICLLFSFCWFNILKITLTTPPSSITLPKKKSDLLTNNLVTETNSLNILNTLTTPVKSFSNDDNSNYQKLPAKNGNLNRLKNTEQNLNKQSSKSNHNVTTNQFIQSYIEWAHSPQLRINRCVNAAINLVEANAQLLQCVAKNAENFRICIKCNSLMDHLKMMDMIYMGPSTDELRPCNEQKSLTRLTNMLVKSNSALYRLWHEARCNACFNRQTKNVNDLTKQTLSQFSDLRKCISACTQSHLRYTDHLSELNISFNDTKFDIQKCNDLQGKVCDFLSYSSKRNSLCQDVIDEWLLIDNQWKTSLCFEDMCPLPSWSHKVFFISLALSIVGVFVILGLMRYLSSSRNSTRRYKCCSSY